MVLIFIIPAFILAVWIFMRQPQFGKLASGKRLELIKASSNFREGKFQNQSPTPDLAEGATMSGVLGDFLFRKSKRARPSVAMPSKKTNLLNLNPDKDILVWFGHASYFMQIDGKKILVDPVFSGSASPLAFSVKAFKGADVYTTDDIPRIDYLFISHDHWDHLDYQTIIKLNPKIKKVITGLGTASHLEFWGYDPEKIIEKDWNEEIILDDGFTVNTTPARHFSGRGFKRMQSLWMSFVLKTPTMKIFIGGDSGYDKHFAEIGNKFGPFDLAILECGQYNKNWRYIHSMPEEVLTEAKDLKAAKVLPVHFGKFVLALHAWDEPLEKLSESFKNENIPLLTPMIGEEVPLKSNFHSSNWWKTIS